MATHVKNPLIINKLQKALEQIINTQTLGKASTPNTVTNVTYD